MDVDLIFLNLDGLDATQKRHLEDLIHPSNLSSKIEFPWSGWSSDETNIKNGNISSLNVHAPVFETYIPSKNEQNFCEIESNYSCESFASFSKLEDVSPMVNDTELFLSSTNGGNIAHSLPRFSNGFKAHGAVLDQYIPYSHLDDSVKPINGDIHREANNGQVTPPVSSFKLNPTVSCFVPQSISSYAFPEQVAAEFQNHPEEMEPVHHSNVSSEEQFSNEMPSRPSDIPSHVLQNGDKRMHEPSDKSELLGERAENNAQSKVTISSTANAQTIPPVSSSAAPVTVVVTQTTNVVTDSPKVDVSFNKPMRRSWADIVSSGQRSTDKVPLAKSHTVTENKLKAIDDKEIESLSVEEDKMALVLGRHLHELELDFRSVCLQPRGLINRRNWCYINATLQALLASSPFYTLLRNLPLGPGVERGKSSTPVIDSMVKVTYEFSQLESSQEELQVGQPFQPDFIYDMLRDLKSDCLKGQQEDAEEFLSFILNNMHEEMVKIIKNYEKKNGIGLAIDVKENGEVSDGEEEWQVIGSKHKGMVTRKVVEHKTPISDLLGGQIKSFLTTSGSKTSASIQPFFTLQLDVQSENVNSVSEALKEMTVKEPIQGYTCAKTKQEVEAYNHIALQKLPPVLILHLKRFVYNKNGGCKKVLKKTDYPLELELSKDLFSSDVKKSQRIRMYRLFAVMYHDGEEAIKGHYISDVYNSGSQTWIRCDDRQVTAVTEAQVLSHSPPRVPYLLFYQES